MSYDAGNKIATFTPSGPLASHASHTATLIVTPDRNDNIPAVPLQTSWQFQTALPTRAGDVRTIWEDADEPGLIAADGDEVELGLKFRSDSDGSVLGVRFYKAQGNVGAHTGTLWSADGSSLATAAFTAESAAGWQEVRFGTAVPIQWKKTYAVSYHAPNGRYGATNSAFTNAGKDSGLLHALKSGVSGPNGVFHYGPHGFPADSYEDTNYWVEPLVQLGAQPRAIWADTDAPTLFSADPASVELGLKFRSDVDGVVAGVRFYKGTNNTGVHIGTLWNAAGGNLGSATFADESASGWQEVRFAAPVAVKANTTYVVSYYAPNGCFAATNNAFTSVGKDNAPLHALRSGVDAGNGVFVYGASGFPTQSFADTNYWVDVVFTTG